MKFEQVLQIYWTKGFLYSGKVLPFDSNWWSFCNEVGGLGRTTRVKFVRRFELHHFFYNKRKSFGELDSGIHRSINLILSKMSSLNYKSSEIQYLNLVRLYLIKSYRGRAQALGKPSRGQRTWSNAWTAYHHNKTIRNFVVTMQRKLNKDKKEEKINYKLLKKKIQKPLKAKQNNTSHMPTKKSNAWF